MIPSSGARTLGMVRYSALGVGTVDIGRRRRTSIRSIVPKTVRVACAAAVLVVLSYTPRAVAQTCLGDCDGDNAVTVDELLIGVNIALGLIPIDDCPAFDDDSNLEVTVDEIIGAIDYALNGCPGAPTPTATPGGSLRIQGVCLRPGTTGIVGCSVGTQVRAWRCNDRAACASSIPSRTLVGSGGSAAGGNFTFFADANQVRNSLMLLDADVEGATVYRNMDFGPSTGGSGGGAGGEVLDANLDPSSEAAVRLLDDAGVQNFSDDGVRNVIEAARVANQATIFTDLSAADAADLAFDTAAADANVQAALQAGMLTPTPAPQPVVVPTITTSRGCGAAAVFAMNEQVPLRLRVDASLGGTTLPTVLIIIRINNNTIFGEEPIATGEDFFGSIPPSILPPGDYLLRVQARVPGSQNGATATCPLRIDPAVPHCNTACDCDPGQRCVGNQCVFQGNLLYCCTSATCPAMATCQEPGGGFGVCPNV